MADRTKNSEAPGLSLTPRLLIVGTITLAVWVWFSVQGQPLDRAATVVLTVAVLVVVELVGAVPYARIRRALTSKPQRHDTDRRRRMAQKR